MYIRVYKEKKSATQSCVAGDKWILEVIPSLQNSFCSSEMLWNGTKDTHKQIRLKFNTYESAIKYADLSGMKIIDHGREDATVSKKKKSYLENF